MNFYCTLDGALIPRFRQSLPIKHPRRAAFLNGKAAPKIQFLDTLRRKRGKRHSSTVAPTLFISDQRGNGGNYGHAGRGASGDSITHPLFRAQNQERAL